METGHDIENESALDHTHSLLRIFADAIYIKKNIF